MTEERAEIFRRHTGRSVAPTQPFKEAYFVVGRRGGNSRIAALKALHAAVFRTYTLAPGERGVVMVIAADRRQAHTVFKYTSAFFDSGPLKDLVVSRTPETLEGHTAEREPKRDLSQVRRARRTRPLRYGYLGSVPRSDGALAPSREARRPGEYRVEKRAGRVSGAPSPGPHPTETRAAPHERRSGRAAGSRTIPRHPRARARLPSLSPRSLGMASIFVWPF